MQCSFDHSLLSALLFCLPLVVVLVTRGVSGCALHSVKHRGHRTWCRKVGPGSRAQLLATFRMLLLCYCSRFEHDTFILAPIVCYPSVHFKSIFNFKLQTS